MSDPAGPGVPTSGEGWAPWPAGSDQEAIETRAARRRSGPVEPLPEHPRYAFRSIVGRGGQGIVYRAHDAELDRDVAVKTLRPDRTAPMDIEAFLEEARAAASLEHPNIIPIYDVGTFRSGQPFFSMKLVTGRVLSQALAAAGSDEGEDWTLVRLVQVVQEVALALQYAHERGMLHRDVKPSNVLLGHFGEVFLVDWGIARNARGPRRDTSTGQIKGTLSYMSPEQARGSHIDARADVYALGSVLYQVLTGRIPFDHESEADLVAAILRDEPPPPQDVARTSVPPELAELALRALRKDPAARPQSAREMHEVLQGFVEGVLERHRRMQQADVAQARGAGLLEQHRGATTRASVLAAEVERLEKLHPPWQPIPEKLDLLEARAHLEGAREEAETSFVAAADAFSDAIAHLPDHVEARKALADMHWERFRDAEHAGDSASARAHRAVVERYHDGRMAHQLSGEGSVRVRVDPPRARWRLMRLVERHLVMVDGPEVRAGAGDVEIPRLEMGSYVLVAEADGHEPARYPICIERNTEWDGELRLLRVGELPPGFVYIPGTEAWLGGDPKATNSAHARLGMLPSIGIAAFPVTFGEYAEFLEGMGGADCDSGLIPRSEDDGRLIVREEGRWVPRHDLLEGETCEARLRLPVFGVTLPVAERHVAWIAARDGRPFRLPTSDEWERAARGVDRRVFPWGNRFDATLCAGRDSTGRLPAPVPVGRRPSDRSVYGVCDLAGGVTELTATNAVGTGDGLHIVRGGSWSGGAAAARAAWRGTCSRDARNSQLGYRIAIDLNPSRATSASGWPLQSPCR